MCLTVASSSIIADLCSRKNRRDRGGAADGERGSVFAWIRRLTKGGGAHPANKKVSPDRSNKAPLKGAGLGLCRGEWVSYMAWGR